MEEKLFWVFSGPSSRPVSFFLRFLSEPQTFLLSGMCFRGLWATNFLNLFQVGALLSSSLVLSLLSSLAWALWKPEHTRKLCMQLACSCLHLFFLMQILIQSQMIPILRVLCSLTLFLIFNCTHLWIFEICFPNLLKSMLDASWLFLSLLDNYDSVGLLPTHPQVSCHFHCTKELFSR